MGNSVLILGASGRFGRAAAEAFENAGWRVSRFDRKSDDLHSAVRGMDVVVNAWNPPTYNKWAKALLMHRRVIDALKGSNTTVIVPGNVYVFGEHTPGPWGVDTPHKATNPLARLRMQMEADYRASGVRTILLRAGDFLDTSASGNWFDMVMITALAKGRFTYPAGPDVRHAWAFLPDIARAAVQLAEKRMDLPAYADIPFSGYTLTGQQVTDVISSVMGRPVAFKKMNWMPLVIAAPFWPMFRGLLEMRYLWGTPHELDDTSLKAWLPDFRPTPVEHAIGQAIWHAVPDATWDVVEAKPSNA